MPSFFFLFFFKKGACINNTQELGMIKGNVGVKKSAEPLRPACQCYCLFTTGSWIVPRSLCSLQPESEVCTVYTPYHNVMETCSISGTASIYWLVLQTNELSLNIHKKMIVPLFTVTFLRQSQPSQASPHQRCPYDSDLVSLRCLWHKSGATTGLFANTGGKRNPVEWVQQKLQGTRPITYNAECKNWLPVLNPLPLQGYQTSHSGCRGTKWIFPCGQ